MVRRVGFGDSGRSGAVSRRRSVLGRDRDRKRPESPTPPTRASEMSLRPKSHRKGFLGLLFILFPLIFAGVGGYMMIDAIRFSGVAVQTVGTVVDVHINSDSDGTTYTPVFQYTDGLGRTHTATTHISSSGYNYSIGEREEILYNPGAPSDDVRINGLFSLWGMPVIFLSVGMLVFFGMVIGLRKRRRKQARA